MTIEVPTAEPTEFYAGTTVAWTRTLSDYPASTYTLTYYLSSATDSYSFNASASGDDHAVTLTAALTAAWKAGVYKWLSVAIDGATKYQVGSGSVRIRPNFAAGNPADRLSEDETALAAIRAVLANRATKDQEAYTIAGRSLQRTPIKDLLALESHYALRVARDAAGTNAAGQRRIFVRLARP